MNSRDDREKSVKAATTLSPELYEAVEALAVKRDRSVSYIIRWCVEQTIQRTIEAAQAKAAQAQG